MPLPISLSLHLPCDSLVKGASPEVRAISSTSSSLVISNELYRSNWDLSAQRAVAVAEELRKAPGFDEGRMAVIGKADTAPLLGEDDAQARSRNRRVEIAVKQGKAKESEPISVVE